jgi:Spy/CpxP family protein refolding chaperone
MKRTFTLAASVLAALVLASPSWAQPPRGFFAWWDSPLARDLNLREDQQKQIRETVREYRSKLIDLRAAAEKAELDMEEAFNEEIFDARRANEAVDRLVAARGDLTRTLSQMGIRLRGVLTTEQWRDLQKRREAMRGDMRERIQQRRPGRAGSPSPGGPPPPPQE